MWTSKPWETVSILPFEDRSGRFAFSPDGLLLVGADGGGGQLELWNVASGQSLARFDRFHIPSAVAFRPDAKAVLVVDQSHEGSCVEIWDAGSHELIGALDGDVSIVPFTAGAFTADGKTIILGGGRALEYGDHGGPAIHVWDATTGDEKRRFPNLSAPASAYYFQPGPKPFDCLCCSRDGRSFAVITDHRIRRWELATGKERCLLGELPFAAPRDEAAGAASSMAFSPDGRTLVVGCADGALRLWDVTSEREYPPLVGHKGGVRAVAFAPDGKTVWSLGKDDKVLTWPATGPMPGLAAGRPAVAGNLGGGVEWSCLKRPAYLLRRSADPCRSA